MRSANGLATQVLHHYVQVELNKLALASAVATRQLRAWRLYCGRQHMSSAFAYLPTVHFPKSNTSQYGGLPIRLAGTLMSLSLTTQ